MTKRILFLTAVYPESKSSAAGGRSNALIRNFLQEGWELTLASTAAPGAYADHPAEIKTIHIAANDPAFDEQLRLLQPDVVVFDRFYLEEQFGWRVAQQCPKALRVLDTQDLHSLRNERHNALKEKRTFHETELRQSAMALREVASIYRSDLSLIVSDVEYQLLQSVLGVPAGMLHHIPLLTHTQPDKHSPEFESRRDFMFIGNYHHAPNADAFRIITTQLWPEIRRQLPEANVHLYGAYPTKAQQQAHQPQKGIYVHGRAENVADVMEQARVMLAPLRFGAGMKGKLLEAMEYGLPSVTTTIGAEGIAQAEHWPGKVTDDVTRMVAEAVQLYTDQAKWTQAQQKAKAIRSLFEPEKRLPQLNQRITELLENLENHRQENFTGNMLQHHRMQSTRYLSKWIEAKNAPVSSHHGIAPDET